MGRRTGVRAVLVFIASSALVALALAGCGHRDGSDVLFGYNDDAVLAGVLSPGQDARVTAQAGADSVRVSLDWRSLEPRRDHYDFAVYDRIYREMLRRGIRPLFTLVLAPSWAWGPEQVCVGPTARCRFPPSPEYDAQWRQITAIVARRYPRAAGIEIWNEPNLTLFWGPHPDPVRYTDLLRQAYGAVKEVNPSMRVIGGSLNNVDSGVDGNIPSAEFARAMFDHGAGDAMDAVSIHPYPLSATDPTRMFRDIDRLLEARARGDRALPLWITEVGLSTTGPTSAGGGLSDDAQALALTRTLRLLASRKDVQAVFVHKLVDPPGPSTSVESGFGVMRHDLSRKPAFCALARERGHGCGD